MTFDIKLRNGSVLKIGDIPEGHKIEYLASSLESECFHVVHAPHITEETIDKFPDYYGSFGMHVGISGEMREAKVMEVSRLRDGGTTHINYVLGDREGYLYFPSRLNKSAVASDTFDGKTTELKRLIEGEDYVSSAEQKFKDTSIENTNFQ